MVLFLKNIKFFFEKNNLFFQIIAAKKIIVDFSKLTADDNLDDMDDYY